MADEAKETKTTTEPVDTAETKADEAKETKKAKTAKPVDTFYKVVKTEKLRVSDVPDVKRTMCELGLGDVVKEIPEKSKDDMICIKTGGMEGYVEKEFLEKCK